VPTPSAFRPLHELASTFERLHARIEKGEATPAEVDAELAGQIGVDEKGQRWCVDAAGVWTQVGTDGQPQGKKTPAGTPGSEGEKALKAALAELEALTGLSEVKKQVKQLTALVRVQRLRREADLKVVAMTHHLVFRGNPGTGKTTVARLIGRIYAALGVVPQGQVVEVDRSGLVAEYVGQTAIKTAAAFGKARGGVLFIDEAYTLSRDANSDSAFGQEAIDQLVKLMEDHRDDTVLIVAGYPVEMDEFIETNPGLRSRFSRTIDFADYTDEELVEIFGDMCRAGGYVATKGAKDRVRALLAISARGPGFGNARAVRTLFERAVVTQAERLSTVAKPTRGELRYLTADDVAPALPTG
jgi:replication-associated recombination protein RarA